MSCIHGLDNPDYCQRCRDEKDCAYYKTLCEEMQNVLTWAIDVLDGNDEGEFTPKGEFASKFLEHLDAYHRYQDEVFDTRKKNRMLQKENEELKKLNKDLFGG